MGLFECALLFRAQRASRVKRPTRVKGPTRVRVIYTNIKNTKIQKYKNTKIQKSQKYKISKKNTKYELWNFYKVHVFDIFFIFRQKKTNNSKMSNAFWHLLYSLYNNCYFKYRIRIRCI